MMEPDDLRKQIADERWEEMKRRAHGRWTDILLALGVDEKLLKRKNQPCPMPTCNGSVDRFNYSDKYGEGNYFCRHCGPGGGFKLLMAYCGWSSKEAQEAVERYLNITPVPPPSLNEAQKAQRKRAYDERLIKRLVDESYEISCQDDAGQYLASRGLVMKRYPPSLRFHPRVEYWVVNPDTNKPCLLGSYAAMLGCMQDQSDKVVALQRYYLKDGRRAPGIDFRRMLGNGNVGAAVRLGEPTDTLGTCEGIENGLAVHIRYGTPVWAAMNAGNLEKIWIPDHVNNLKIYGDNDADKCFDGQASAFILARRVQKARQIDRRNVEVFIPKRPGADWAEVYLQFAEYQRSQAQAHTQAA